jgi:hypothetical protein
VIVAIRLLILYCSCRAIFRAGLLNYDFYRNCNNFRHPSCELNAWRGSQQMQRTACPLCKAESNCSPGRAQYFPTFLVNSVLLSPVDVDRKKKILGDSTIRPTG